MARTVRAEISTNGHIQIDFQGFPGETCFDEEESLARILKSLGLWAVPVSVHKKSVERIEAEIGLEEERRKGVSTE